MAGGGNCNVRGGRASKIPPGAAGPTEVTDTATKATDLVTTKGAAVGTHRPPREPGAAIGTTGGTATTVAAVDVASS